MYSLEYCLYSEFTTSIGWGLHEASTAGNVNVIRQLKSQDSFESTIIIHQASKFRFWRGFREAEGRAVKYFELSTARVQY